MNDPLTRRLRDEASARAATVRPAPDGLARILARAERQASATRATARTRVGIALAAMLLVAVPVVVVGVRDAAPGVGFADREAPAPAPAAGATAPPAPPAPAPMTAPPSPPASAAPSPAPSPPPAPSPSPPPPPPSPPPRPAPAAPPAVAPPAPDAGSGASVLVARYGRTGPEVPLAGGDADGSGCAPGPGPLPDGVWYGQVTAFGDGSLSFNLICRYSGERADAHPESSGTDHVFVDDSSLIRQVPVAPEAAFHLLADLGTPDSQTPVAPTDVPAFLAADPGRAAFPDAGVQGWVLIEDGALRELLEPWYA